eukprot:544721-Rhodomonas_salina.1
MNPKRIDINYSSDEEPSLHSMQPIDPYVSDGEGPDPPPGIRPAKKRTTKNFLRAVTGIGGLKIPRASTSVGQVLQLNLAENREELARIARMAVKEKEVVRRLMELATRWRAMRCLRLLSRLCRNSLADSGAVAQNRLRVECRGVHVPAARRVLRPFCLRRRREVGSP